MKQAWAILFIYSIALCAIPYDNPLSTYYNDNSGYPAWTDRVHWGNVIDMSAYNNGSNDFQKFENARDELYSQGGGVLYYPAGTYDFSDIPGDGPNGRGLMLRSGVIIRGETPIGDRDATDGSLDLSTKFLFKFQSKGGGDVPRDWNMIGLLPDAETGLKKLDLVGIMWVHIIGAYLWFGPEMTWANDWNGATGNNGWYSKSAVDEWKPNVSIKSGWKDRKPDGTHPADILCGMTFPENDRIRLATHFRGAGDGRLVFGCIFEDGVVLNDYVDLGCGSSSFYTMFWSARVGVYGSRVFIANNVLPKSKRCFKYSQQTRSTNNGNSIGGCSGSTIIFDYNKTIGIDVNKEFIGQEGNQSPGNDPCMSADSGLYKEGIVVKENWVYNHGHKGFCLSGKFVTVKDNRNERVYLKEGSDPYGLGGSWELTLDGTYQSSAGGAGHYSDNLSRAFDQAGMNVWVHNNWMNNTGSDPGNDGEAILIQEWGGTPGYSWAITKNTHVRGNGESGYIGGYGVGQYGSLIAWNTSPGWVGNTKSGKNIDCAFVENSASSTKSTGSDVLTSCPSGNPSAPQNVSARIQDDDHVFITWDDNSGNEIGFRVDRRIENSAWHAIAYRPRKSAGTSYNKQEWADFLAPANKELEYRVVAISCSDGDGGASSTVGPLRIDAISQTYSHRTGLGSTRPTIRVDQKNGAIVLQLPQGVAVKPVARILIHDCQGRLVAAKTVDRFKVNIPVLTLSPRLYLVSIVQQNTKLITSFISDKY